VQIGRKTNKGSPAGEDGNPREELKRDVIVNLIGKYTFKSVPCHM